MLEFWDPRQTLRKEPRYNARLFFFRIVYMPFHMQATLCGLKEGPIAWPLHFLKLYQKIIFWYNLRKFKGPSYGPFFKATHCRPHIERDTGCDVLWLHSKSLSRVSKSTVQPCVPTSFQLNLACLCWFFHGERSSSYVNRKRVQSYTNNGILNPVDALLQIHLCLFSHSSKLRVV